ncbi:MAG: saccharopine dehydrogenase NADP-binding domain-containing protein [Anaerolineales bacterium]|nr:saccharopine dehydrogenase NADP-binding domain-containing protein [Anaerolineales bacterium]
MSEITKMTVLGTGLVGRAMVLDLAEDPHFGVTAVDVRADALEHLPAGVQTRTADLSQPGDVQAALDDADIVICAVPGFMGYRTLETIIKAGRPVVDISFFSEDPFDLHAMAVANQVTAIVDCGVAPGLCNILAADAAAKLEQVERYRCYVGGLPVVRRWPFEYGAVFSPSDVLEEYLRPARFMVDGEIVIRPALSGRELIDFPTVGTLEAFNTDGLRTMLTTYPARDMVEKTLRYPGHAEIMSVFRETGFLDKNPVLVKDKAISPYDISAQLLRKHWTMLPGEQDFTIMRVEVTGTQGGESVSYRYDLLDRYDCARGITSMARTTGYTATLVARMLAAGRITEKGILPPEKLGADAPFFSELMDGYEQRGIKIHMEQNTGLEAVREDGS